MKYRNEIIKIIDNELKEIEKIKNNINEELDLIIEEIINVNGKVIFSGIGKSAIIAKKISSTFSSLGIASFFINSNEALHGDLGAIQKNDIVIILSNSGNTDEICKMFVFLKNLNIKTIAFTSNANSFLAKNCTYKIILPDINEVNRKIPAPTSSTTSFLVLGDAIGMTVAIEKGIKKEEFLLVHPSGTLGKVLSRKL